MMSPIALALAVLAAHLVNAHYTFPEFINNGVTSTAWQYIRMTDNNLSNAPVTDVTSSEMKCYENSTASATGIATVTAGSTVGFVADNTMGHPGYFDIYMSAANPATLESAGSGQTWFKIHEWPPAYNSTVGFTFQLEGATQFTFTIPAEVPSGQYLLRAEQIALHVASTFGGAQFYIACAQINVVNGGSGTPGPLVSIPGVYTGYEPGILIDIYNAFPANYTGYPSPGPAVWPPASGSTTTAKTTTTTTSNPLTSTSSTKATTTTTTKASSTTTTSTKATTTTATTTGTTVAQYGQCGGTGYTGSTVCTSPYVCTYSNAYYSQCL
ncbi:hypothetical protein FRB93_010078 [Tulasnella sp. JGI-2019a]|nr:hypothetical protein FRB93_010078 [Tulasnella sp. JGI-2019a]